jgi:hypothetical protein
VAVLICQRRAYESTPLRGVKMKKMGSEMERGWRRGGGQEGDIRKFLIIDQSDYPINRSSYPSIQSLHKLRGISDLYQCSIYQLYLPNLDRDDEMSLPLIQLIP